MKKIKNFFIQLLILAIKAIYQEKIELFFWEIGEKTKWQLFTNPVLVPVKKGTRKYYIFEYMDGDGKHRVHLSRHEFNRKGSKFPITITTDDIGMQHHIDGTNSVHGAPFDEKIDYTPDTPESYIGKDHTNESR